MEQAAAVVPFGSTGPQGHRARMRTRLLAGSMALADYEILEMLLFFGIPRRDTKPLAKGLINRFGTLAQALGAGRAALLSAGLPSRAAEALEFVTEAARQLARAERVERVLLGDWDALESHLDAPGRSSRPPCFSALLLNNRNQLLGECPLEADCKRGDDRQAVITRTLLRHALERHATAFILVRNRAHEPADPTEADRDLFPPLQHAAATLSITVHDLITIGQGDWTSLRAQSRGR